MHLSSHLLNYQYHSSSKVECNVEWDDDESNEEGIGDMKVFTFEMPLWKFGFSKADQEPLWRHLTPHLDCP